MSFLVAAHAQAIKTIPSDDGLQWVHVLPQGKFPGRDGRGPYVSDAASVAKATLAHFGGAEVPMDYDHQLEYSAANGRPAPASGWVKELEARDDGLWALVAWTAKAQAHIAAKEYRYVSPVFYHDKDGVIHRLESIALTNLPNLPLKALASQEAGAANLREDDMSLSAVRVIFGLSDAATDAQILDHAKHLTVENGLAKAAQGQAEARADELEKALAAQKDAAPDPARFVPMSVFQATASELADLKAKAGQEAAEQMVAEGVKAGKVSPAMAEWAKEYASKDPVGFKVFMAQAPAIAPGAGQGEKPKDGSPGANPPGGSGDALTAEEKAVCAATGVTEEEYRKARAAQSGVKEG